MKLKGEKMSCTCDELKEVGICDYCSDKFYGSAEGFDAIPKTVDEYLDDVDYEFKGYVPTKEALLFVNFIKEVNDGGEENETPIIHLKLMDSVFNKEPMCAILVFRGAGKTTVFAEYLILFIASFGYMPGFGPVKLMLYVTDSIENGVKNLRRNVEYRFENSEFLQKLIPNKKIQVIDDNEVAYSVDDMGKAIKAGVRFTDIRLELSNYKGNTLVVKGYGASTGVRGAKEFGTRPTLAILDDLISDTDARSATILDSIEDLIYKAVDKALHPTIRKTVYLGTPFNASDPLYKAIESGAWKANVFPVCERFPIRKAEFRGAWDDRFPYHSVLRSHTTAVKVGKLSAFYQEMMLQIHSEEDTLLDPGTIKQVEYTNVVSEDDGANYYITTDFATSEKESADFSTMVVWHHSRKDHYTIVDGYCNKSRMKDNINTLFNLVEKYKPKLVGIEISGQQGGFIDWLEVEMTRRGKYFTLAKKKGFEHLPQRGIRPNKSKILRLESMIPMFERGQISIATSVVSSRYGKELFDELKLATRKGFVSKHDDAVDAMTQLMDITTVKPSEYTKGVKSKPKDVFDMIFSDENYFKEEPVESSYII
jgi:predicted phage terminase large subunit-like protein